uniref:Sushi domain-containing protein n=1 Tax=Amphiprion percula TaxID=161767 RepID=A0A3P8U462_AMPPE
ECLLVVIVTVTSCYNTSCPCPRIPPLKLSEPPPEGCYQIEERYRYQCVEGYVRKAGTSNEWIRDLTENLWDVLEKTLWTEINAVTLQKLTETLPQ